MIAAGAAFAVVAAGGLAVVGVTGTSPAVAAQDPTSCQGSLALTNGGFEQPAIPDTSYRLLQDATVPGWQTTATDHQIELWSTGFNGTPSSAGRQFAELNATQASTLFQDVPTTPGQTLGWSLDHRGRAGTDTMRVIIGAPGGTLTQSGANLTDGNTAWGTHTGTYKVPAGQTTTRFGFQAVSSAGGNATVGNFLDNISFGSGPCVVASKTVQNLSGHSPAQVGDTLRYTVSATNSGGTPAPQTSLADPLDAGLTYVPGSLKITAGSGTGTLTDASGDDRGEYTAGDRTVTVRLGDGATASAGAHSVRPRPRPRPST
ncbi:hypothetical protein GCM10025867_15890 [Frondihabitans sucicola]|uniref:DUF11 domain-containing protein n=1 Tax=Frondihabitans sucicola TaxID=1268041 RepID=A0ABN6XWM1_9MICO|nr:isopeptide-forming domain-containing fimbrial protein [Frondihabitans sucicola]BDZ49348.1 hypothetical protein GCM10025867_15890 [Frondihabitans sucicola]